MIAIGDNSRVPFFVVKGTAFFLIEEFQSINAEWMEKIGTHH